MGGPECPVNGNVPIVPNGTERQPTLRKRFVTVGINAEYCRHVAGYNAWPSRSPSHERHLSGGRVALFLFSLGADSVVDRRRLHCRLDLFQEPGGFRCLNSRRRGLRL